MEWNGMFCVRAVWNTIECSGIWGESYRTMENVLRASPKENESRVSEEDEKGMSPIAVHGITPLSRLIRRRTTELCCCLSIS